MKEGETMKREINDELRAIAERYKTYGVTLSMLIGLAEKAPPELPDLAVITGIRMLLCEEYGTNETFTVAQAAACTGETPEEVRARIKAEGIQVIHQTVHHIRKLS